MAQCFAADNACTEEAGDQMFCTMHQSFLDAGEAAEQLVAQAAPKGMKRLNESMADLIATMHDQLENRYDGLPASQQIEAKKTLMRLAGFVRDLTP